MKAILILLTCLIFLSINSVGKNNADSTNSRILVNNALNADDQFNLGRDFFEGKTTNQSFGMAYYWYKKSADLGNTKAMNNLGVMHLRGLGLPKNESKGYAWLLEAAKKGDPNAQYACGVMLCKGVGVTKDCSSGVRWLYKASNGGNLEAKGRIAQDLIFGDDATTADIPSAIPLLVECAENGNKWACGTLGTLYRYGYDLKINKEKRYELLKKGALLGDAKSMMELGIELSMVEPTQGYPFLKLASERISDDEILKYEFLKTMEKMSSQQVEAGNASAALLDKIIRGVSANH